MKNYVKPMVLANEELAEGVYAASGAMTGDDCYSVTYNIHQRPQEGRGDYRIQFNATHGANDGHHSAEQNLIVAFNMPVEYAGSGGTYVSGSGTNTIVVRFNYHSNATEGIGLGDLIVKADAGLAITSAQLTCSHGCGIH